MMKTSAGILILYNHKALLAHSTNSSWWKSYTPPKGGVEEGETFEQTASREVAEELGIAIDPALLKERVDVEYRNAGGSKYKTVILFIHRINTLSEISLETEHVPFSQLQKDEIDEAKFMDAIEIEKKVLPRYIDHIIPLL